MDAVSPLLRFSQGPLLLGGLVFLLASCGYRLARLSRWQGSGSTRSPSAHGGLLRVLQPWCERQGSMAWLASVSFLALHLGVLGALGLTISISLGSGPGAGPAAAGLFQLVLSVSSLAALYRLGRRFFVPGLRAISGPDDFFALGLLATWFAAGVWAAPYDASHDGMPLLVFFFLSVFFLCYLPLGKTVHAFYRPFIRRCTKRVA